MGDQVGVSILGATGSVGDSTLDVMRQGGEAFRAVALTANTRVDELIQCARKARAEVAVIADPKLYGRLKDGLAGTGIEAAAGPEALIEAAERPTDRLVAAIVGVAGLPATLAAVRKGTSVALANKESLVCGGSLLLREAKRTGAQLLPIDSEHNAIFQVLDRPERVEKLILTASGGPFRNASLQEMAAATPEQALKHPVWDMGAKITIDCATMMNKGLELIEAAYLFDTPESRIEVLVHPQSIVHSLVAYDDGSVLAQLGLPDMRTPISYALAHPRRMALPGLERLDLAKVGRLDFQEPDLQRFPALRLAREAAAAGGAGPITLNAANEVAVAAFLQRRIGFLTISQAAGEVLHDTLSAGQKLPQSFDDVFEFDRLARVRTLEKLKIAA